ncbi:ATP-binding cassette subfamily B protein [Asanoa ferruginea]|uniref:ATP-binding cassette subfamily B protein n=1 Tax=Asanoa ferruginea TaxID=53367 RepID=A0A3D9ZQ85_9ACTN|nr:ABC transporter ATP-binding protein [Asanoa ferruginea]REF99039.1 ATP-binding cassette subfamily B protein [Asanoa ferruginea]GIF46277.1 ABC transporter [Asanoa ferruginea]
MSGGDNHVAGRRHSQLRLAVKALGLGWRAARAETLILLVLTCAAAALPGAAAWLGKLLLDELALGSAATMSRVTTLVVLAGVIAAMTAAIGHVSGLVELRQRHATSIRVTDQLYRRVNAISGLRHFEDPSFLDQLRLAEQGAQGAPDEVAGFARETVRSVVTLASFAGVLIVIWPPMALLLIVVAVPATLVHLHIARLEVRAAEQATGRHRRRAFFATMLTDPRAAKEIRLFGLGRVFHDRMIRLQRSAAGLELRVAGRTAVAQTLLTTVGAAVVGLGGLVVARGVLSGRLTIGDVGLFGAAVAGVQGALFGMVFKTGQLTSALSLFRSFVTVLETPADLPSGRRTVPPLRIGIEFRDVWFRYGTGAWILSGVSLVVPHGTSVGLVGANGAGKSTMTKLLCRFYDPDRGQILWDGIDIREFDIEQLRSRIQATFQDYMNFDLTARENIGIGDIGRVDDRARIRQVAEMAQIHEMISGLPRQYDAMLSRAFLDEETQERGVLLSGGQWQRVALARSLMREDADLLILDEPNSGLDVVAEHSIHHTLHQHRRGRTSLLVSHRLAALRDADLIAVLVGGRIAERGSHDVLMAADGEYAGLFRLQASGYQDERVAG